MRRPVTPGTLPTSIPPWVFREAAGPRRCRFERAIIAGRATPSSILSHELDLTDAPTGYDHFDKRDDGWTKVLLHP